MQIKAGPGYAPGSAGRAPQKTPNLRWAGGFIPKREIHFKHDEQHEYGLYALGESRLTSFNEISHLSAFIRLGIANHAVSRFSAYAGTGAVLSAPFNSRPGDQAGFALAMPFSSPDYRDDPMSMGMNPKDFEMNIEHTYRFFITNFISIQADGQFIIHPNALADRPNDFAFGLRTQLNI